MAYKGGFEADAVCPFYKRVRWPNREIVCESAVAEAAISALRFNGEQDLLRYFRRACCNLEACHLCPIYMAIEKKYTKPGTP